MRAGRFTPPVRTMRADRPQLEAQHRPHIEKQGTPGGLKVAQLSTALTQTDGGLPTPCASRPFCTTVLCGYVFADFGSGVFHWATDNYGSDKTPVLGGVIAAFQVKITDYSTTRLPTVMYQIRPMGFVTGWMNAWVADNESLRFIQGHHLFPWTITKRAMLNNVHKVAIPTIPFQAAVLVAPAPGYVDTFVAVTCFLVVSAVRTHHRL